MEHVINCEQFSRQELKELFDLVTVVKSNPKKYWKALEGKIITTIFFEPSTRTRLSFEAGIQRLGASVISTENATAHSSAKKGETLEDTIKVLAGYSDAIVMRHSDDDSAQRAMKVSKVPIINAGSGKAEHPTQSLLDAYTIYQHKNGLDNVKIAVLGDLKYGRTIHSLLSLLSKFENIEVYGLSKKEFELPNEYIEMLRKKGIEYKICNGFGDIPKDVDVLHHTRIQSERFEGDFGKEEFIINKDVLDKFSANTIVMHPLPKNNEISDDIDSDPRAMYFEQAENGMWVRMALLLKVLKYC